MINWSTGKSSNLLLIPTFLVLSSCSSTDLGKFGTSVDRGVSSSEFDVQYTHFTNDAQRRAENDGYDLNCFKLGVFAENGTVDVYFLPKSGVVKEGDSIVVNSPLQDGCRSGLTYRYGKTGEFRKVVYHR